MNRTLTFVQMLTLWSGFSFSGLANESTPPEKGGGVLDDVAKTAEELVEKTQETEKTTSEKILGERTSKDNRRESIFTAAWNPYSFLSLPVSKKGVQAGFIFSENWSLEPEYQWGEYGFGVSFFDVGKIAEKNYLVTFRRYFGNSFNLKFGPGYHTLDISLGDELLSKISRENLRLNLVKTSAIVWNLGIGNRWQFDNGITLGSDWFEISVPLKTKMEEKISPLFKAETDRKNAVKILRVLRNFPSITAFKLQIGYTF